ncbi:MAG: DNA-binding protein [Prevotella sp.]|nr:DNA-binding protein [Prevotella sp.]
MIRFRLYQNNNKKSELYGKWYARAVAEDTFNTEKLAKHMSEHNSPYSPGVILGVLKDMISCTKELVLDGKNVKLDDLAIFSAGLVTKPASSAKDFSAAANIKSVRLRARATGTLRTVIMTREARTRQMSQYNPEEKTQPGE